MSNTPADFAWKQAVRFAARTYVKLGYLPRLRCKCGSKKSEMHHPDYAWPFRVVWLCRRCHAKEHVREYARPRNAVGQYRKL